MKKRISLGIDIGTTDIKCCLYDGEVLLYHKRMLSPKTKVLDNIITFYPEEYFKICKRMYTEALTACPKDSEIIVSIVSQAPSLCLWSGNQTYGISYLSFYSNPKDNSKGKRIIKSQKRLNYLLSISRNTEKYFLSGLTGFIIHGFTGKLTIDAVTAWEMGIEEKEDLIHYQHANIHFPVVHSPLDVIYKKKNTYSSVTFIAGTTDSAVLPLALPCFADYYIYLGSWGSLLKTKIESKEDYRKVFWSSQLHKWLISEKDMIKKCNSNVSFLRSFFQLAKDMIPDNKKVAICGGLTIKYKQEIKNCINTYFYNNELIISKDINTSMAASRLGLLLEDNHETITCNSSGFASLFSSLGSNGS